MQKPVFRTPFGRISVLADIRLVDIVMAMPFTYGRLPSLGRSTTRELGKIAILRAWRLASVLSSVFSV